MSVNLWLMAQCAGQFKHKEKERKEKTTPFGID